MMSNDAELVRAVCQKDKQSFEHLYKLHYKKLYLLAYSYVHNREQAEEIVHDVFLKIWNHPVELIIKQSLGAYLSKCIINCALNVIKKGQRADSRFEKYQFSLGQTDEDTDDAQVLEDKLVRLEHAIETLPPHCKKVLMMSKFENRKQQEIADILDISIKTVKNHLTHAYEKIRLVMNRERSLLVAVFLFHLLGLGLIFPHAVLLIDWNNL